MKIVICDDNLKSFKTKYVKNTKEALLVVDKLTTPWYIHNDRGRVILRSKKNGTYPKSTGN
jgi:hypothetical protein